MKHHRSSKIHVFPMYKICLTHYTQSKSLYLMNRDMSFNFGGEVENSKDNIT